MNRTFPDVRAFTSGTILLLLSHRKCGILRVGNQQGVVWDARLMFNKAHCSL